jgi:hypothetical protein
MLPRNGLAGVRRVADMMYGYGWSGTMGFGPVHWIVFIAMALLVLYPVGRILGRIGFSPLWSALLFVPIVNLLALWIVAMTDWPESKDRS